MECPRTHTNGFFSRGVLRPILYPSVNDLTRTAQDLNTDVCVKFILLAVVQNLNRKGRLRTHYILTVCTSHK
jgi:hypothetical protein